MIDSTVAISEMLIRSKCRVVRHLRLYVQCVCLIPEFVPGCWSLDAKGFGETLKRKFSLVDLIKVIQVKGCMVLSNINVVVQMKHSQHLDVRQFLIGMGSVLEIWYPMCALSAIHPGKVEERTKVPILIESS